jgi:hypothetical protein
MEVSRASAAMRHQVSVAAQALKDAFRRLSQAKRSGSVDGAEAGRFMGDAKFKVQMPINGASKLDQLVRLGVSLWRSLNRLICKFIRHGRALANHGNRW